MRNLCALLLLMAMLIFTGCSTTVYTRNFQEQQLIFPNRNAVAFPIKYRIHLDDKTYFVGYNVRITRTHIYYTQRPSGQGFTMREIEDIRFITYAPKTPGLVTGAIAGLVIGNIAMNIHDGHNFRSSENLFSDTAILFAAFGGVSGTLIGAPQKVHFNHYLRHDPYRFRRHYPKVDWIVE